MTWNSEKALQVEIYLTSSGNNSIFGPQNPLTLTDSFMGPYGGKVMQTGAIELTGSGTKDSLALTALSGDRDRAYLYLFNSILWNASTNHYVKVGLRSAHGTESASGDWFATLPSGGQLIIPISDMQNIDLEPSDNNPLIEYILFQKSIG